MRKMGLEPTRYCYHKILSLARLPIITISHHARMIITSSHGNVNMILKFVGIIYTLRTVWEKCKDRKLWRWRLRFISDIIHNRKYTTDDYWKNINRRGNNSYGIKSGTSSREKNVWLQLGLINKNPQKTMQGSRRIIQSFKEQNGTVICKELKGINDGIVKRECIDCVRDAAALLEAELPESYGKSKPVVP